MKRPFLPWLLSFALLASPALADLDEARRLLAEGRHEVARRTLESMAVSGPEVAERALLLTHACNGLENWECGMEYGKQAAELLPDSSDAQYQFAVALRNKMQNIARFKAMFMVGDYKKRLQRAIDLDSKNYQARQEQIGFFIEAPGVVGGDRDRARKLIAELKREDWKRAMEMEVELAFKEERDDDAVAALEQMIERDAGDTGSRLRLAYWYQRNERYREADATFAPLAEDEDEAVSMTALYQRARTRILGEFEAEVAVRQLQSYLEQRPAGAPGLPSRAAAYWRMGNAYELLSDVPAAKRSYREALSLEPDNKDAKRALRSLGG